MNGQGHTGRRRGHPPARRNTSKIMAQLSARIPRLTPVFLTWIKTFTLWRRTPGGGCVS
jgi:hypothetical protein